MTAREIADGLNSNKWYVKGNGTQIMTSQITARINDHHELFAIDRSTSPLTIRLYGRQAPIKDKLVSAKSVMPKREIKVAQVLTGDSSLLEKMLMNEKNFKSASTIDNLVSLKAGLYCIRITDINQLPKPFNTFLTDREHNIIYIGIATESLQKRFLNQELRAKGHGTFFRSIGAVLGYRPPKGSLVAKKNKHNYKFAKVDEQKIIKWINDNLNVNWVDFSGDLESIETRLIDKYRPLINLAKNPSALQLLSDLRKECVQIANEL
ncbi:hypothetical protein LJC12_00060 [Odoribacter sp. OttesenSCG-928-J03]|nr:hypothetical protein [Odoribacter sp. OttesenSCG-928-J03]MDL2330463.1 hypothetical protein [Odoribacter sp. OttesenSCG-928-A06]